MPSLSPYALLWYFVLYSFLGWCIEVVFCSANTGKFVNRGFLNGPVCPIYGFGAVAIVLLLTPVQHSFLVLFAASVAITSLLELVVGFALQKLFHTRWWDYSAEPFNLGGYICLKFSLAWGLGGVLLMRVLHPMVAGLVGFVPRTLGWVVLAVLLAVFLADAIVTINVLTKLNRDLGEITRIAEGLHQGSETLAKGLGNTAIGAAEKINELDLDEGKERLSQSLEENKKLIGEKLEEKKQKLTEKTDALAARHSFSRRRLLRAFPDMKHNRYAEALQQLKEKYGPRGK